jgi:thioredoxin-related protein
MGSSRRPTYKTALVLTLLLLEAPPASAHTVRWQSSYGAARREAAQKDLPLLLIFSARSCGWCQQLKSTTLRDPRVVSVLNQHFVPLMVSTDDDRNDYLVSGLRIHDLPAIVAIAPQGKILASQAGYVDPDGFVAWLDRARAFTDQPESGPPRNR